MSNAYDAQASAPDAEPDITDAGEPGEGESEVAQPKSSKDECNYRAGTPIKNCGLCAHYFGNAGPQEHTCEVVEGNDISQFGFCNYYEREENPYGQQLGPREVGMVNDMMNSPPDQSLHAQQAAAPATTIGSRTYR